MKKTIVPFFMTGLLLIALGIVSLFSFAVNESSAQKRMNKTGLVQDNVMALAKADIVNEIAKGSDEESD